MLSFKTFFIQLFDNVGSTRFGIRVARLAFQQNKLNLTIFVQIPVWIRFPVFGDKIALDNPGFFGVGTHIIGFIVAIQRLARWLFVKEHHRHILPTRFVDNRTRRRRVNQVDGQRLHPFRQQHVDLIVLFGLIVLRVIHQQLHVRRRFAVFFDRFTHNGHEVVVILVDRNADTGIRGMRCGAKKHASHDGGQS